MLDGLENFPQSPKSSDDDDVDGRRDSSANLFSKLFTGGRFATTFLTPLVDRLLGNRNLGAAAPSSKHGVSEISEMSKAYS